MVYLGHLGSFLTAASGLSPEAAFFMPVGSYIFGRREEIHESTQIEEDNRNGWNAGSR